MQRADHGRTLVSSRECLTHQQPRAAGSNSGSPNLCKELHRPISTAQDRQHHSSSLHKQPRYCISRTSNTSKEPVDVVPREEHPHHSPTPPRCSKQHSRCGVSDYARPDRLEVTSSNIPGHNNQFGPIEVDLFASRLTSQCQHYFSWQPDPYAATTDAFLQDWSTGLGFANPP